MSMQRSTTTDSTTTEKMTFKSAAREPGADGRNRETSIRMDGGARPGNGWARTER